MIIIIFIIIISSVIIIIIIVIIIIIIIIIQFTFLTKVFISLYVLLMHLSFFCSHLISAK